MTIEDLRNHPVGKIVKRVLEVKYQGTKHEATYYLGKSASNYFIGFSEDGNYCSNLVSEEYMVKLLEDSKKSDEAAADIYFTSPQLCCWMY